MTEIIRHRRNKRDELVATPTHFGVEVDIRSQGDDLIIHHDPFAMGEWFEDWLTAFQHGTLILNVKEEGLEKRCLSLMDKYSIERFFFLDQSFPFLIKTARSGERRCAVRISEYESIETAFAIASMIDWVWVDCFSRLPLTGAEAESLRAAGLKLCLVSPELLGRDTSEIPKLRALMAEKGIEADAVCTKEPDAWT